MYFGVKLKFNVQDKRPTEMAPADDKYLSRACINCNFNFKRLWSVRWNCWPRGNHLIGSPILHCCERGRFEICSLYHENEPKKVLL